MANGPFGNPLSTGIALSGVIDLVTPVRQAEERKRQREAAEKKAQDERAKELGAIMGKIAVDEDKIWWRYHDDARLQYADTIDKISQMYNTGDYAGMYKTINQFDTKMANYIQATNQKNARAEELKKGGYYMDYNLESMSENRDIDNAEYAKYLQETGYGTLGQNGIFSYMPNSKVFDIKDAWERSVKGEEKKLITEAGKGYKQVGTTPTGVIAETDYAPDVLSSAQQRIMNEVYADPYRAARILEKEGYDVKSLESIADPQERATRTQEMFSDYIMKNRPGFGEQILGKWQPRASKPSYTFGEDSIGDVAFSGTTPSGITSEAPTPEQEQQALTNELTSTIQRYLEDAKAIDPNNVEDKLSGSITKNFLANYGLQMLVSGRLSAVGKEEVAIQTEGGDHLAFLDPTSQSFVQDLTNIVLEKGANVMDNTPNITPETTVEEFLKPESNAFTVQMAGGKTPKTDWSIPGGTTVILAGDDGSVEVKLRNDITLQGGKFQKAANYKDKSGKVDTYYDIMFPIEYQGNDDLFADFFGDDDALSQFKLKNRNQLPKSLYVKEDENTFNTLLSILQTRENKGEMNKSVLQKAMDKYMKPLSEVDEFGFPIEN